MLTQHNVYIHVLCNHIALCWPMHFSFLHKDTYMKLVKFAFLGMALISASHTFAAKPAAATHAAAPVAEAPASEAAASEVQANDAVVEAQVTSAPAAQ